MNPRQPTGRALFLLATTSVLAACGGGGTRTAPVIPTIIDPPAVNEQPPLNGDPAEFKTTEYNRNWGLDAVKAADAYAKGYTGDGVIIGVVDFNFDFTSDEINFHAASRDAEPEYRSIYEAQFGKPTTDTPHGQAVAVVAAGAKNNTGTHGVAFDAEVIAVDFFSGVRSYETVQNGIQYTVSNPYLYAYENGARVINKSLGFDEDDVVNNLPDVDRRYTLEFETSAIEAGALVVASAGNNSDPEPSLSNLEAINRLIDSGALSNGPGALILAGAVDENLEIAPFSDQAGNGIARNYFLVAPGVDVVAPWVTEENGAGLYLLSGTSFSAPHITGAAALILDRWPSLTGREVADILFETATDLGETGTDSVYGRGLLNIDAALSPVGQAAMAAPARNAPIGNTALLFSPAFGDTPALQVALESVMILDGYGRDFRIDASGLLVNTGGPRPLETYIGTQFRSESDQLSIGKRQLGYTVSRNRDSIPSFALTGAAADDFSADVTASFEFTGSTGNIGWIMGTGRSLTDALHQRPVSGSRSLIGADTSPLPIGQSNYFAISQPWGETSRLWIGIAAAEQKGLHALGADTLNRDAPTIAVTARLEKYSTHGVLGLELGVLSERDSLLGTRSAGGLKVADGAATQWLGLDAQWSFSDTLWISFDGTTTLTQSGSAGTGIIGNIGTIWGTSATASMHRSALFHYNDEFKLSLHQPLRVETAKASLWTGQAIDADGNVIFSQDFISLAPSSRELAFEMGYFLQLDGWRIEANVAQRLNAGHQAGLSDTIMMLGLKTRF
ncbi:MAG: S8 family serine peptidase [Alphaproteobacteria bacterium]|nr:S8 family serine peptidase [Alphaproteobacteria bacterium]